MNTRRVMITYTVFVATPDGYTYPKVDLDIVRGELDTWDELFKSVQERIPTFSYPDDRMRCWVIPHSLISTIEVVSAALGGLQPLGDIGLIQLKGISPEMLILSVIKVGSHVDLFVYCRSSEYPFTLNPSYESLARTVVALGPTRGRTMSALQQMAIRLCFNQTMADSNLRSMIISNHARWPEKRAEFFKPLQDSVEELIMILLSEEFISHAKRLRHERAIACLISFYIYRTGTRDLEIITRVYSRHSTFPILLQGLSPQSRAWVIPYTEEDVIRDLEPLLYLSVTSNSNHSHMTGFLELDNFGDLLSTTPLEYWLGAMPYDYPLLIHTPEDHKTLFDTPRYDYASSISDISLPGDINLFLHDAEDFSRFILWCATSLLLHADTPPFDMRHLSCIALTRALNIREPFRQMRGMNMAMIAATVEVRNTAYELGYSPPPQPQKLSLHLLLITGDCCTIEEFNLHIYPEDTIERFIDNYVECRCWIVPPGVNVGVLSIAMRCIWERRPVGLIELLGFTPDIPLAWWITRHGIECTLLVQTYIESNIIFETLYYEEHTDKVVLDVERVALDTLYHASLSWIYDPSMNGMLKEGRYELVDPNDGDEAEPTWMSVKAALRLVKEARNVSLASLS